MEGNGPKSLPGGVGGGEGGGAGSAGCVRWRPEVLGASCSCRTGWGSAGLALLLLSSCEEEKKKRQEKKEKSCHHRALRTPGLLGPVPSLCLPVLDPPGRALPPPGPLVFLGTMRKPWGIWHSDTVVVVFFYLLTPKFWPFPSQAEVRGARR